MMSRGKGASAMDAYDGSYKQLEYDFERTEQLPMHILIFRKALYIAQMLMCIGAVVVMGAASMAQHNGIAYSQVPWGTMEKGLIYVPLAAGSVSIITGFVGCIGAHTRSKIALVAYVFLVASALGLAVAGSAQGFADVHNVERYARRQWNILSDDQTDIIQVDDSCCNFDTLSPCCRFAAGTGECSNSLTCFETVSDHLVENFNLVAITCMLQAIYLFGVTICAVILYKYVEMKGIDISKKKGGAKTKRTHDFSEKVASDDDFFS